MLCWSRLPPVCKIMGKSADQLIARIASRQYGLFALFQSRAAGIADHVIASRLASGRLIRIYRAVYLVAGAPPCAEQEIMAAALATAPGSAASHGTSAYLWKVVRTRPQHPEIVVPYSRSLRIEGVIVHRSRTLRSADLTRIGAIPLTRPPRTLIDLSSALDEDPLEDAFDDFLRRDLLTARAVLARLELEPTSRGTRTLRRLARDRIGGHKGESRRENDLRRLLRRAGLPEPDAQVAIRDARGRFIARADLAYRDARVVVEYDSWEWHSGRKSFEADKVRRNRMRRAGWSVLEITGRQVRVSPQEVIRTVEDALETQV